MHETYWPKRIMVHTDSYATRHDSYAGPCHFLPSGKYFTCRARRSWGPVATESKFQEFDSYLLELNNTHLQVQNHLMVTLLQSPLVDTCYPLLSVAGNLWFRFKNDLSYHEGLLAREPCRCSNYGMTLGSWGCFIGIGCTHRPLFFTTIPASCRPLSLAPVSVFSFVLHFSASSRCSAHRRADDYSLCPRTNHHSTTEQDHYSSPLPTISDPSSRITIPAYRRYASLPSSAASRDPDQITLYSLHFLPC